MQGQVRWVCAVTSSRDYTKWLHSGRSGVGCGHLCNLVPQTPPTLSIGSPHKSELKRKTSNRRVGVCETNEKTDWQEAPYILRAWTSHFQQLSFLRAGTVSVFFTTVYTPCPAQGLVCNHTTKEWKKCFLLQAGVCFGDKPKEFAGSQELAPNSRTKTTLSTKYLEPIYSRAQPCWSVSVKSAIH